MKAIGDAKRNPSMAGFHDNFWSGVKAWKGAFDNMGTAANYTGSAVAEGRWKDAARGAEGLGQMGETLAQVPGKVATQMVVGAVTFPVRVVNNAWAFGTAARECMEGKRGGWDVVWHGTMLAGDATSLYYMSGARARYARHRNAHQAPSPLASKEPLPPGWNENWKLEYGVRGNTPHWWDPTGGEWRWHAPDKWHPVGHWDYNPWTDWNSPWQNIYPPK